MNYTNSLQTDLINLIKNAKNIIISTHINPDGDGIGSMLALYHYTTSLGAKVNCIINDFVPKNLKFLNGASLIEQYSPSRHNNFFKKADLIIIVDLNDSSRLGDIEAPLSKSTAYKIVIDHHTNPKDFANYYYIDTNSAATGQLIWNLFQLDPEFELTKDIAEALYTAIVTDTGSFRYPRTNSSIHNIIAQLIDAGADPTYLYDQIYNQSSFNVIKLLGIALSNLKLAYDGRVCVMQISSNDFRDTSTNYKDTEFFVERTLSIEGVLVGVLITEVLEKGIIKISIRSKFDYDVASVAQMLGGGGHINAAGATIKSLNLQTATEAVIRQIGKLFEK
ncbi:MAG: DHH family phosphoesterase [Candidatus Kapaibacteriota bacterium]